MWYVISIKNEKDKRYAFLERIPLCNNLVGYASHDGVEFMMLCKTKKHAIEVANGWNDGYRANGNFIYDEYETANNCKVESYVEGA